MTSKSELTRNLRTRLYRRYSWGLGLADLLTTPSADFLPLSSCVSGRDNTIHIYDQNGRDVSIRGHCVQGRINLGTRGPRTFARGHIVSGEGGRDRKQKRRQRQVHLPYVEVRARKTAIFLDPKFDTLALTSTFTCSLLVPNFDTCKIYLKEWKKLKFYFIYFAGPNLDTIC